MMISAARLRGRSHSRCEDRFSFKRGGSWHVAALSDGTGSSKHASDGAKEATRAICKMLASWLPKISQNCPILIAEAFKTLQQDIPMVLRKHIVLKYFLTNKDFSIGDYAGTLLFAAYHPQKSWWLIGHLGDGVIAALNAKNKPFTLSPPDNGEYANSTRFFTEADAYRHLRLYLAKNLQGVLLMSDGSSKSLYQASDGTISPAIIKFFQWQKELGEARTSSILRKNIEARLLPKTQDDCSMLLIQQKDKILDDTIVQTIQ